jgi:adenylosuccinate synthase
MALAKQTCHEVFAPASPVAKKLSSAELSKITGELALTRIGWFDAKIYNGTQRVIGAVTIEVTVVDKRKQSPQPEFVRQYRLTTNLYEGEPLTASDFKAQAGFTLKKDEELSWTIVGAEAK